MASPNSDDASPNKKCPHPYPDITDNIWLDPFIQKIQPNVDNGFKAMWMCLHCDCRFKGFNATNRGRIRNGAGRPQ